MKLGASHDVMLNSLVFHLTEGTGGMFDYIDIRPKKKKVCFRLHENFFLGRSVGKSFYFIFYFFLRLRTVGSVTVAA